MGTNRDVARSAEGEQPVVEKRPVAPVVADTFPGRIQIEWDGSATVTLLGQLPFFIEYLKSRPRVRNALDPQCENYLAIHRAALRRSLKSRANALTFSPTSTGSLRASSLG